MYMFICFWKTRKLIQKANTQLFFFSLTLSLPHAHGSKLPWVGRILEAKFMGFVAKSKRASTPERHMKVLGTLTLEPGIVRRKFEAQNDDPKLKL